MNTLRPEMRQKPTKRSEEISVMAQNGLRRFHRVINNKLLELDVQQLLNGLEGTSRLSRESSQMKLYIIYSRKDKFFRITVIVAELQRCIISLSSWSSEGHQQ